MKNHIKKKHVPMLILIIFYLLTRLFHLTLLPIFNDEAIYLYWAKLIAATHAQWFISLTDGKPPILIWVMAFFLKLLPSSQYLLAGRLPSVVTGLVSMLGIYALSHFLFHSRKIATLTAFLYIIVPFALFYDRMALFDGFLSSMMLLSVYFSLRTSRSLEKRDAFLWGFFLGMAFLAKINALLFLFLTPVCFFLFSPRERVIRQWKKMLILSAIAIVVSQLLRFSLIVSHGYQEYTIKSVFRYALPLSTLVAHPFLVFPRNIVAYVSWFTSFITVGVFFLGIAGFVLLLKTKRHIGIVMALLWGVPILATSFVSIVTMPRYIFFVLPYFLIVAGYAAMQLIRKSIFVYIVATIFIFSAAFDALLLWHPPDAPLPEVDYYQYVSGYPSGYGLGKIFAFLYTESKSKQITVVPLGMLGSYPYAFHLEFWNDPHVTVVSFWPVENDTREKILALSKATSVYVVMKDTADGLHSNFLEELHLGEILRADKPNSDKPILLAVPQLF